MGEHPAAVAGGRYQAVDHIHARDKYVSNTGAISTRPSDVPGNATNHAAHGTGTQASTHRLVSPEQLLVHKVKHVWALRRRSFHISGQFLETLALTSTAVACANICEPVVFA